MNILVAQSAGFCWGVRHAMDAMLEASVRWGSQGPVQMLGPLIHNPQALEQVALRGVVQSDSASDVQSGTVIIRAHGIPLPELRNLKERHRRKELRLINGTCPEVAKVQARIKRYAARGYFTVLLGTRGHAEAIAHESYASSGFAIVSNIQEANALAFEVGQKVLVIAQTTFLVQDFEEIATHIRSKGQHCAVFNTICKDTWKRQREAEELCRRADFLLVIGGKSSNNTRHLVDLAREAGKPFQWVESATDLDLGAIQNMSEVGVLAGASTPTWTVDEVVEVLEQLGHASRFRLVLRIIQTLQLPLAVGLGLLTFILHRLLAWSTNWVGLLLPVAFHTALCAGLPYLDPLGLNVKGRTHGLFLEQHRWVLFGFSGFSGFLALASAASQGWWVLFGTMALAAMAIAYQRQRFPQILLRIPAQRDISQAMVPAFLAVMLPGIQHHTAGSGSVLEAFTVLFSFALAIHGMRHLRAFREDRILGLDILPMAIGSRATKWLAVVLLMVGVGVLGWMVHSGVH